MTRKLTTEEFIASAKEIHNNYYTYENTVYVRGSVKVDVTCPVHGSFWVQPQDHKTNSTGCPKCARERTIQGKVVTPAEFIKRATEIHKGKYDYSNVSYNRGSDILDLTCPVHGRFLQKANSHLTGRGCPLCANIACGNAQRGNTEDFINSATGVHGDKYSYKKVDYCKSTEKVEITCSLHGGFLQTPSNHLSGAGCPTCGKSGFNKTKPASFYILKSGDMTKVGITNVAVTKRLKQLCGSTKHDFVIIHTQYFKDGVNALNLETETLRWLSKQYNNPIQKFQGSTETFFDVNLKELLHFVSPLSKDNSILELV